MSTATIFRKDRYIVACGTLIFLTIMTDYHCHLLPCIDDGPSSLNESIEMARLLSHAGYQTVYCTPHLIKGVYETDNTTVREAVINLQKEIDKEGITLKLLGGREYFLDNYFIDFIDDLQPLENTSYLLIEIPSHTYPGMVQDTLTSITQKNLIPLLAHPERCDLFQERECKDQSKNKSIFKNFFQISNSASRSTTRYEDNDNKLLNWLIENRCAFQSNLPSFNGTYGALVQKTANYLSSLGIYTHSGTDAHSLQGLIKLFGSPSV